MTTLFAVLFLLLPVVVEANGLPPEGSWWKYEVVIEEDNRSYWGDSIQSGLYEVRIEDGRVVGEEILLRGRPTVYDSKGDHKWFRFPLTVGKEWD